MHKLARQVRFSANPFLPEDGVGFNSFASKPAGEGLAVFFELCVELSGEVEPATGFVVNVTDIDKAVGRYVVPIFADGVRKDFRRCRHIGLFEIAELLKSAWGRLADKFGTASLSKLSLKLNPFRKIAIDSGDCEMVYFGEKFAFAAAHRLWNDELSRSRNLEVFGKCANPAGHGHNYVVEVTVEVPKGDKRRSGSLKRPAGKNSFRIGDFERTVDSELIELLDHKNLNADVARFGSVEPTVENIAVFAWDKLAGRFGEATLHCVTVWESEKTYCSYFGSV